MRRLRRCQWEIAHRCAHVVELRDRASAELHDAFVHALDGSDKYAVRRPGVSSGSMLRQAMRLISAIRLTGSPAARWLRAAIMTLGRIEEVSRNESLRSAEVTSSGATNPRERCPHQPHVGGLIRDAQPGLPDCRTGSRSSQPPIHIVTEQHMSSDVSAHETFWVLEAEGPSSVVACEIV